MDSGVEAAVSAAEAAVVGADMEAGADKAETGGEVAVSMGQGGEAMPEKDSERCDPSRSKGHEKKEGNKSQLITGPTQCQHQQQKSLISFGISTFSLLS